MSRERRAAMGRGRRKGEKPEVGGENRPAKPRPTSPLEWGTMLGARGLYSGGKPMGVPPGCGWGGRVATGHQHPWSDQVAPGGQNPQSDHRMRGRTEGRRTGAWRGKTPTTTRATGSQGDGGGNNKSMGRPRMVAPPRPQPGTAADDDSAGTLPRHTAGTNVARPKHGALARRKCGLLAPTGMAVDQADAGDPVSAAGRGAMGNQDGKEPEEKYKTLQRALPVRGTRDAGDVGRGLPKRSHALNASGHQGGERGRGAPTQQRAHTTCSKGTGGNPQTRQRAPPPHGQDQDPPPY